MKTESSIRAEMIRQTPGYVDRRYLQTAEVLLQQPKQRTYELMHVQPGQRILDLGCGPATDTINLARLVGPTGSVLGIDHDPEMVAEANRRAEEALVQGWTKHVEADATSLPLESGSFDGVRSERVFQHLPDPEGAFAELVRVTKAGGWIVVADPDWGTFSINSTEVALERRYAHFMAGFLRNGYAGRRLYGHFTAHHLTEIAIELSALHLTSYSQARFILLMDQVEQAAVATGALSQEEIDRLRADLERADAERRFFASGHGMLVAGRKP